MTNTKLVISLVVALLLGFAGGYLGGMVGGSNDLTDLTDRVDKMGDEVENLEARVGKMPDNFSSFASVDAVNQLKTTVDELAGRVQGSSQGATNPDLTDLRNRVGELETQVDEIEIPESTAAETQLKVGYVNATEAFQVFTDAVKEERETAQAKNEELVNLREQAIQGEISEEEFRKQSDILQAEQLKAKLGIDLAMVEKMMNSRGFESVAEQLEQLKGQVDPIMEELNNTLSNMREGKVAPEEVSQTLSQINSQYTQLDDLLTRLIEQKIFQITNLRADEAGYDLVFRQENIILYRNSDQVADLTETTKEALRSELRSG